MDVGSVTLSRLKRGSTEHIRGFLLNKLFNHGCVIRSGGQPRGHHSITNMKKGYPKEHRGKFEKILQKMKREGLLVLFPHSGDGELHVSAVIDDEIIEKSIEISNTYREAESLPPWNREFEEVFSSL